MTDESPTIETERLRLEPLAPRHLAGYAALIAQPDVHRYLSRAQEIAADPASQATRIVTVATEQWASRGYGPFALFEKGSDVLIGRGGLFWIEALQDVEINYMLDPTVWGRGYATEAAAEFLAIGFDRHDLARMVATTNPANAASAHVLQKVGMKPVGKKDLGGGRLVDLHEISREAWRAGQAARMIRKS
ncbi:GNAT family N-acetyltransferase [Reyranella sp.]|uniref:GNAT family N-acetyltransferase n=1 Tax=Reyranella sp. TaxID=1929291 RepID=UPI003783803C